MNDRLNSKEIGETSNEKFQEYYENNYLPYIIKKGKFTTWLSIPLIFIPPVLLFIVYGARPSVDGVIGGMISAVSAMVAWYVVDPVTLYPILQIPGMYMTYIAGNSKEIRIPASMSALSAAKVETGTREGTVITAIAISVSIFISVAVMTIVALTGQFILSVLPEPVLKSLNYLLPALFGAMAVQRILLDLKSSLIILPFALAFRYMNMIGLFKVLPFGGSYAQILLCVIIGVFVSRMVHKEKFTN